MPPLTWGLAPASKTVIARHFEQCGPWAVPQLQEISSKGLYYSRPELASQRIGRSRDKDTEDTAVENKGGHR